MVGGRVYESTSVFPRSVSISGYGGNVVHHSIEHLLPRATVSFQGGIIEEHGPSREADQ